jgi:hypothetical protein
VQRPQLAHDKAVAPQQSIEEQEERTQPQQHARTTQCAQHPSRQFTRRRNWLRPRPVTRAFTLFGHWAPLRLRSWDTF